MHQKYQEFKTEIELIGLKIITFSHRLTLCLDITHLLMIGLAGYFDNENPTFLGKSKFSK